MSDSVRHIMSKAGTDNLKDEERAKFRAKADEISELYEEEDKTELEKRHDRFRARQERASRLGPAAERLPILTREESERREKERPQRRQIKFEGPIEKLIEKHKDAPIIKAITEKAKKEDIPADPDGIGISIDETNK